MTRFRTQLNRSVTHLWPRKSLKYQHVFEYRPVSFYAVDYCTDVLCIKDGVKIDPACGSDSLLLKAEIILRKDAVRNGYFWQEINITTYNLCRINMFQDLEFDNISHTVSGMLLYARTDEYEEIGEIKYELEEGSESFVRSFLYSH